MLANIAQPGDFASTDLAGDKFIAFEDGTGGTVDPEHIYNRTHSFAAKIEDASIGNQYNGFDWVTDQAGSNPGIWGSNTPEGQKQSAGAGNLRTIDVADMFTYCAQLANATTPIGKKAYSWTQGQGAPNPLVGQFKDNFINSRHLNVIIVW